MNRFLLGLLVSGVVHASVIMVSPTWFDSAAPSSSSAPQTPRMEVRILRSHSSTAKSGSARITEPSHHRIDRRGTMNNRGSVRSPVSVDRVALKSAPRVRTSDVTSRARKHPRPVTTPPGLNPDQPSQRPSLKRRPVPGEGTSPVLPGRRFDVPEPALVEARANRSKRPAGRHPVIITSPGNRSRSRPEVRSPGRSARPAERGAPGRLRFDGGRLTSERFNEPRLSAAGAGTYSAETGHVTPVRAGSPVPEPKLAAKDFTDPGTTARDKPRPAAADRPLSSGQGMLSMSGLSLIHHPDPRYPRRARLRGWEGTVVLVVAIDGAGRPGSVRIRESSGHTVLDRSARRAVRKWRFQFVEGRPGSLPARALVPIRFRLRERR